MRKILFSIILSLFILILASRESLQANSRDNDFLVTNLTSTSNSAIGSKIDVAVIDTIKEENPAVAVCGEYYLVVYEREGNIYGQRLDSDGDLVGEPIVINDNSNDDSDPDVACLWPGISVQTFVVVWTYDWDGDGSDYDVQAQAVTSGGSLIGDLFHVANSSTHHELKPAIACRENDYYCLVVFEYAASGVRDIRGQRFHLTNFGLELDGDPFDPGSDSEEELNPDLAWSMPRQEYLVTWQRWYEDYLLSQYRVIFSSIFEVEKGPGVSEIKDGPYWLYPTGYGFDFEQQYPAVAFNNQSEHYLVTYAERGEEGTNLVGVLLSGSSVVDSPFRAAQEIYSEETAVAFSGGPGGASNAEDEFLIAYSRFKSEWEVQGAYVWQDTLQDRDFSIGTSATFNHVIYNPDVTGYSVTGTYLVVWDECNSQSPYDCNVYGQLYGNGQYSKIYLPLIISDIDF